MKALIEGNWHAPVDDLKAFQTARHNQSPDLFRDRVSADGASGYRAETGRYHLYVSYACPFAHRTMLYRKLMGLEAVVSLSVVHPRWGGPDGWTFGPSPDFPEVTRDHVNGRDALWQVYRLAKPDFTGKVTVPVLWDKTAGTIVSTESAEIIRMFDTAFADLAECAVTFYPRELRAEIDALGGFIRKEVNGGVYGVGFAANQQAYDSAVRDLFLALDQLEARLDDGRPYLLGDSVTEADWLLFPTLVRFDAVYVGALKCSLKRLVDYPNLLTLTRRLYGIPGVAQTVRLDHVKRHYYDELGVTNPTIVPAGPATAFLAA